MRVHFPRLQESGSDVQHGRTGVIERGGAEAHPGRKAQLKGQICLGKVERPKFGQTPEHDGGEVNLLTNGMPGHGPSVTNGCIRVVDEA